jgi:hypothetical protein
LLCHSWIVGDPIDAVGGLWSLNQRHLKTPFFQA